MWLPCGQTSSVCFCFLDLNFNIWQSDFPKRKYRFIRFEELINTPEWIAPRKVKILTEVDLDGVQRIASGQNITGKEKWLREPLFMIYAEEEPHGN